MLPRYFAAIVDFCIHRGPVIIAITAILALGSAAYVERHFAINSNLNKLLSPNLTWVKRDAAYMAAFPQQASSILAVVTAPTPEFAGAAAATLAAKLTPQKSQFHAVSANQSSPFFARESLLYLSPQDLQAQMSALSQAAPLLRTLASDPSLRGLSHTLSLALGGLQPDSLLPTKWHNRWMTLRRRSGGFWPASRQPSPGRFCSPARRRRARI